MIIIDLERVAVEQGLDAMDIQHKTGLPMHLIQSYWHNSATTINISDLEKLCEALYCEPGQLINFGPEPQNRTGPIVNDIGITAAQDPGEPKNSL